MTKVLKASPAAITGFGPVTFSDPVTASNLQTCSKALKENLVVAFPTETVYGLGGNACLDVAVQAIYAAKNRPADNPLIVHVSSVEQLHRKLLPPDYKIPEAYHVLISEYWPGPLTILLPVLPGCPVSKLVTAGQSTFAVRLPLHPVARALIELSDTPVAAPSANASTRPLPTMAAHVVHDLNGRIPFIVDGGACEVGLESTVVDGLVLPPMLLRPGGVLLETIRNAWPNVVTSKANAGKNEPVKTPGMKYKHYSPTAKVVLARSQSGAFEYVRKSSMRSALLTTKSFIPPSDLNTLVGSLGTTAQAISHNLFRMLREMDDQGIELIVVEAIGPEDGGLAVMNRLEKAASEIID